MMRNVLVTPVFNLFFLDAVPRVKENAKPRGQGLTASVERGCRPVA